MESPIKMDDLVVLPPNVWKHPYIANPTNALLLMVKKAGENPTWETSKPVVNNGISTTCPSTGEFTRFQPSTVLKGKSFKFTIHL